MILSEQIRQFLRNHPSIKTYYDLEEKIIHKKERIAEELPLSIINNLILKHINIDNAQLELNSKGYTIFNFREEVEKYYTSWQKAFEQVKIPYIINALKA